jgi:D-alanyl-lipoteichoic acid acyltransferase DltB (MBOAT superfamily)
MTFNSIQFLFFLPLALMAFYVFPQKKRWIILLLLSYVFYAGWKIEYLILIIYSTLIDYVISLLIHGSKEKWKKKLYLAISLISNFGLLILFKYFHFLIGGSSWFKSLADTNDTILWLQFVFEYGIPVGISFYTFQTVSYTLDVYHGRSIPEKNFGKFALFVSFFPQLVAGPIERYNDLHPQLFKRFIPEKETFRKAFQLMVYGFFLKMVIADNLGDIISPLYVQPKEFDLISRLGGALLFGFQIFADFFGYTLIAIGVAGLFGVKLQDNFRSPYGSYSLKEFWAKWHISLSTWFRDYVYIPLGGSKYAPYRWILAIILTFGLSGLWHGASATFIYWGLFHGVYYLIEQKFFPAGKSEEMSSIEKMLRWTATFLAVMIGWVFFRAGQPWVVGQFLTSPGEQHLFKSSHLHFLIPLFGFFLLELSFRKARIDRFLENRSTPLRWIIYTFSILCILLYSSRGDMQFIYFQF